jgi:hypothetical protein
MVPSPPEVGRWRRCKTTVTPRQAQRRCGPHERTARPAVDDRAAPAPGSPPHPAPPSSIGKDGRPPHAGQGARSGKADTCLAQTSSGPMNMMLSRYGTRFNTTAFEVM